MRLSNEWFTTPAEGDNGDLIIVSGRYDIKEFMESGKFNDRIEVSWKYDDNVKGMPDDETAALMEAVQESLQKSVEKNKLAILTGIYTGGNERTWIFYARNNPAFGVALNEALVSFPLLPLHIYSEKDPDWEEYKEMYGLKIESESEED